MKRTTQLLVFLLAAAASAMAGQGPWSFRGTVTKMQLSECGLRHGFMAAMSGVPIQPPSNCPEYTIMTEKVVYVVVARRAEDFMPLAENMEFLIRKNDLVVFSSDEKTESHFTIRKMTLRAEWEQEELRKQLAVRMMERSVNYEVRNPPRATVINTDAR